MSTGTLSSGCSGCHQRDRCIHALETQVADLQQQLQTLRQQLDELQRSRRRQTAPFRRRRRKAPPKKPGRPAGHAPAQRPPPDHVDVVHDVPLPDCPHCHGPLQEKTVPVQYQTDIPPVRPVVTQFNLETGYCPHCHGRVQGRHPQQTSDAVGAAANQLGPHVLALAAEMKHRLGVPYRQITELLVSYWNLSVSPAALVRACHRLARLTQPTYQALIMTLRGSAVVHGDSTGWRIGGDNAWLWVFSAAPATVYLVTPGRGHDVPAAVLGSAFDGVFVGDGAKEFEPLPYYQARCLGHILRRCRELQAIVSAADAATLEAWIVLLRAAIDLGERRATLPEPSYAQQVQGIEDRLDQWLLAAAPPPGAEVERLIRHLCAHRGEWLVFLHEAGVPPTNNHAEQMLRPAVISRKIGGCNKTKAGATTHSILSSILVTAKRLGHSFVELAVGWFRNGEAAALPP